MISLVTTLATHPRLCLNVTQIVFRNVFNTFEDTTFRQRMQYGFRSVVEKRERVHLLFFAQENRC